ncbi:4F5 family protein [Teladorsagia circumcincta]|uniref:4F5 family protein n=1 Tax=Teladorsagia circumcincta TaxID=45464 RepID=A0A2G9UW16_TELCI|nr:4F5 family protein [Teladorsagia circumcincta]
MLIRSCRVERRLLKCYHRTIESFDQFQKTRLLFLLLSSAKSVPVLTGCRHDTSYAPIAHDKPRKRSLSEHCVVGLRRSYLGGNQRDLARERNLKKQLEQKKKAGAAAKEGNAGLSTDARKIRDAEVMRIKQEKAAAKKAADDAAKAADAKKLTKIDPLKISE